MPRKIGDWEVPDATASRDDAWRAPGQSTEFGNVAAGLRCKHCGRALGPLELFSLDGDLFCAEHCPPGAVSARALPDDPMLAPARDGGEESGAGVAWSILGAVGNVVLWILSAMLDE